MNVDVKFTYKDLLSAPDDGKRYEIFEGELIMSPSPSSQHQRVVFNLCNIFGDYLREIPIGEVYPAPFEVYFDEETVVQPDVLFVSKERLSIVEERRVNGPPDAVVEILSDSSKPRDREFKLRLYAKEGVKEYWIVDPEAESIEVYQLKKEVFALAGKFSEKDEVTSPYFVGLQFSCNQVFK